MTKAKFILNKKKILEQYEKLKKLGITQLIKIFFQKRLDFKVNFDYKGTFMVEHRSGQNRVLFFFQNQLIR